MGTVGYRSARIEDGFVLRRVAVNDLSKWMG